MILGMYEIVSFLLSIAILFGIKLMSSPKTAIQGNLLSALSMFVAVLLVLYHNQIISSPLLWIAMALGSVLGYIVAIKVTMIQMPQLVSLLNGFGGGAAALIAIIVLFEGYAQMTSFSRISSQLTLIIGCIAFSGSVVAAAKLDRRLPQRPIILKGHNFLNATSLFLLGVLLLIGSLAQTQVALIVSLVIFLISLGYGVLFSMRVGGADMPIVISLLITYAGFSNVVLGFAINDVLLVAIGAIVGAAGAILTKLMCKAMNRSLAEILNGSIAVTKPSESQKHKEKSLVKEYEEKGAPAKPDVHQLLKDSKKVIIVPGYGMALAQAQQGVKRLFDILESQGKEISFAIHPVAGRMPGHMNVLLAEVDIPYEQLLEMDDVNPQFKETDVAIIIGACDVVNPEAITAEGTPIYGMPILRADEAKNVIVLNLDTKPGYSGVNNSLYDLPNVHLLLGNAAETVEILFSGLNNQSAKGSTIEENIGKRDVQRLLKDSKKVIIVPGYGMALAQAQQGVKRLFDLLESQGKEVNFAIHPVAGRMPGHMNVLLAEVDIPYEQLLEMDDVNPQFKETDVAIIIGACDVVNPEAITAEGTPIYGMPILRADEAKNVIVLNLDTKPGYSGVNNSLYDLPNVHLLLGNAAETVEGLVAGYDSKHEEYAVGKPNYVLSC